MHAGSPTDLHRPAEDKHGTLTPKRRVPVWVVINLLYSSAPKSHRGACMGLLHGTWRGCSRCIKQQGQHQVWRKVV